MKIGVIADDFTGASDIALTLAEAGMSVAQYIGVPKKAADPSLGAGVVALKSRTAPASDAIEQSLLACDWLLEQGAEQIVFKVCSTFDSTRAGNIGQVLDALAARLQAKNVIVCPAFPENGRSVYQGHLFVNERLLNESGMQDHPLTPMTDANLLRVMAAQSHNPISLVPAITVMLGAAAIHAALPHTGFAIVDAIRNDDLMEIGKAAAGAKLLCGGSGITLGLPANFGGKSGTTKWAPISGPALVISGSCSRATREQVNIFKMVAPWKEITAEDAVLQKVRIAELADWVMAQASPALVYSSADPEVVKVSQENFGLDTAAKAIENLMSGLAAEVVKRGVTRLVVAGGETSGAVVTALKADILNIGPKLAAGVPAMRLEANQPIALALKSGNFGEADFFTSALKKMESPYE